MLDTVDRPAPGLIAGVATSHFRFERFDEGRKSLTAPQRRRLFSGLQLLTTEEVARLDGSVFDEGQKE